MTIQNIKVTLKDTNTIVVENIEEVLATTLFYSLRRIANSMSPNFSLFAVCVPNLKHEYENMPNLKEHSIDLFKQLSLVRIKLIPSLLDAGVVVGRIKKSGVVTAGDITFDNGIDCEVKDRNIVVCTTVDETPFECTLYFNLGQGFIDKKENMDYNAHLELFADQNPIFLHVNYGSVVNLTYNLEHVTVTKYQTLVNLTIGTDDIDAVLYALSLLRKMVNITTEQLGENCIDESKLNLDKPKLSFDTGKKSTVFAENIDLNVLNLKPKLIGNLKKHGISSIQELVACTKKELLNLEGITAKAVSLIVEELTARNLYLKV